MDWLRSLWNSGLAEVSGDAGVPDNECGKWGKKYRFSRHGLGPIRLELGDGEEHGPAVAALLVTPRVAMSEVDPVLRILCADDNRDTADTLVILLEIAGLEARATYDGISALAVAEEMRPDVLILDLSMPGLNGDEVGRRSCEQAREHCGAYRHDFCG